MNPQTRSILEQAERARKALATERDLKAKEQAARTALHEAQDAKEKPAVIDLLRHEVRELVERAKGVRTAHEEAILIIKGNIVTAAITNVAIGD